MLFFDATESSHSVELDCDILAFYNDEHYIFFQRYQEHGHKEDDGVYVEYNDALHSGYDLVKKIVISNDKLEVLLNTSLYKLHDVDGFVIDLKAHAVVNHQSLLQAMFDDRLAEVVTN